MIKKILFIFSLLGLLVFFNTSLIVKAVECDDKSGQEKVNCLQNKVNDLKGQAKTLSSQISIMDNQIKLTEARIEANKREVLDLTLDIDTATKKISTLSDSLNKIAEVLINRIIATYKAGRAQPLEILLSSSDASNLLAKLNYLRIARDHDKKLMIDVQQAKSDYANQRNILETKREKVESLKKQLEAYTNQLEQEMADKETLLSVTKNDELVYQQKLQAALAEQRAIESIAAGGGNAVSVGKVKEGDLIGYMISGKSACSSGTHLHFEVHKDGNYQDPSGYLTNKSVTFENSPDGQFSFGGSWRWPLNDPIYIEQGYGMTTWARLNWYNGGPHTGIDIYSSSPEVYSVKDGELFRGNISCGGGRLLFSRVDQSDGIKTFYLHIAPNN